MDCLEAPAVVADAMHVLDVVTDLTVSERLLAWWRSAHFTRGTYYNTNLGALFVTDTDTAVAEAPNPAVTTSAWDNVTLGFVADNAKLPGQVYVRHPDGTKMAFRGGTPGSRMSLAPLVDFAPPRADGTDYALDSAQFILGPVFLATDKDLFAAAGAEPGVTISASPRNASALVITKLDVPAQPETSDGETAPAPAPIAPVVLEAEHQKHAKSLVAAIEAHAIAGVHDVESEAGKAWHELRHLLRIG